MDAFTSFANSLFSIAWHAFALFLDLVLTIFSFIVVFLQGILTLFHG